MSEYIKSDKCDCCNYPAKTLKVYTGDTRKQSCTFCQVCASTFFSHCITYPEFYGKDRYLWASLGWIANKMLDEISKLANGSNNHDS